MFQQTMIWLDGTPTQVLPLPDRATDFGDGVFETLLVHGSKPLFVELHLERLGLGLEVLSLPDCRDKVCQQLESALFQLGEKWLWTALRISVVRGPGPRGYAPAKDQDARILLIANEVNRDCTALSPAARLSIANIRLATQPALAGIKHLNRLEQVMAAAQAQADNMDECLVLNQAGDPVSVIAGNLFLVSGGEILTPVLADCGVAGTRRRCVIERWAPALGLNVREANLTLSDLEHAEEVFYSNSLQTVRPVQRLNQQTWSKNLVCEALFCQFLEEIE